MSEYKELLRHPKWQRRRLEIMERDDWKCLYCDAEDKPLNVHHKRYVTGRKPWEYPDHDLITLCDDCHGEVHRVTDLYRDASFEKKKSIWHKLVGQSDKTSRIIEYKMFMIFELSDEPDRCIVMHIPTSFWFFFQLPAEVMHQRLLVNPEYLPVLRQFIVEGGLNSLPSGD